MQPKLEIVEQPMPKGQRFRYKCEGKSAGSLLGVTSTQISKSYPSIRILNHTGPAAIVVSCVTRDEPYYPHPHNLVGQDCKNGVCSLKVKNCKSPIVLANVGVQCCKKQDINKHLEEREKIRVDPFGNMKNMPKDSIDLGVVRLCFQAFLPDANNKFTRSLNPIVSDPVIDKKCIQELVICRTSIQSGSCLGDDEMFILCEKISKDDISVRFFEETDDGVSWEDYGKFKSMDVHRQCAIVLRTPPYKDQSVKRPVNVYLQLCKPSDSSSGEAIKFTYQPQQHHESKADSTRDTNILEQAISSSFFDELNLLPKDESQWPEPTSSTSYSDIPHNLLAEEDNWPRAETIIQNNDVNPINNSYIIVITEANTSKNDGTILASELLYSNQPRIQDVGIGQELGPSGGTIVDISEFQNLIDLSPASRHYTEPFGKIGTKRKQEDHFRTETQLKKCKIMNQPYLHS